MAQGVPGMTEETIFLEALNKQGPAERAAYLGAACAGDAALRARVEALLASHADPDSFLDMPALLRQAGEDTPTRTFGPPGAPATLDKELAFLAPAREPGSLGGLD